MGGSGGLRKFLVSVPEITAPAGLVGQTLISAGAGYDTIMPVLEHATASPGSYTGIPREPGEYAGLVIMGGAMSADDTDRYRFLAETMNLIRRFEAAGRPVLGICLGAQIIARAYGGSVYRMDRLESGFYDLNVTDAGDADPVFAGMGPRLPVFHNHYEAVRGINDAVTLVTGGACPVQAFRVGRLVYGVQFHIEVTIDIVREWIRMSNGQFSRDEPKLLTDLDRQFQEHFRRYRRSSSRMVRRWMRLA
jgi:GMP synthase-like glutamine amidotransferase